MNVKTDTERRATLTALGLDPDAPALVSVPEPSAKPDDEAKRRSMPASEIEFDVAMLDGYVLDKDGKAAASRMLFAHYKSPHKDTERHGLLHRRISDFISQVALQRKTKGQAKASGTTAKIKSTKEQRDIAALLAAKGITAEDLAELLAR